MLDRLEQIENRYEDLGRQLADPQLVTDQQKYHKTAKAHRDLEAIVGKYRELKQAQQGIADATSMLSESDAELAAMAQEELTRLESHCTQFAQLIASPEALHSAQIRPAPTIAPALLPDPPTINIAHTWNVSAD